MSYFFSSLFVILFGFFSLAQAYHGIAMVVNGDVEVISHKETEKLKVGTRIFQGDTLITSSESYAKIVMTDRNVISIPANSKVTISKYENDGKDGIKNVELKLENGSVRCDVKEKYDTDKNKFQIKTQTVIAGVRGTDFLVNHDSTSMTSEITTFKGAVLVEVLKEEKPTGDQVLVKAGQMTKVGPTLIPEKPTDVSEKNLKKLDSETMIKSEKPVTKDSKKESKENKKPEEGADSKQVE